jgi:hypothetical protein
MPNDPEETGAPAAPADAADPVTYARTYRRESIGEAIEAGLFKCRGRGFESLPFHQYIQQRPDYPTILSTVPAGDSREFAMRFTAANKFPTSAAL